MDLLSGAVLALELRGGHVLELPHVPAEGAVV
jgi:hypothetical protein